MDAFYRLRSYHGYLIEDIFVFILSCRDDACVLINSSGSVTALRLIRSSDYIYLYDPIDGFWAGADPDGRFSIDRARAQEWERFWLVPESGVPQFVRAKAATLADGLVQPFGVSLLRNLSADAGETLEIAARLASPESRRAFALAILDSPADARRLQRMFPHDEMATIALPDLAEWAQARNRRQTFFRRPPQSADPRLRTLPASLDHIAVRGSYGQYVSLPFATTILARQSVQPTKPLCIVASARNEGIYLLDWIAYHRAIGVSEFFIYTNDNDDGSDDLLRALAETGTIHWFRSEVGTGGSAQIKAYAHALKLNPHILDYRWALFIDLDEFFAFDAKVFADALEYIRWIETRPCDAVALNWVFYGPSGEATWRDEFIGRRFPSQSGGANPHVKTFMRPHKFVHAMAHHPHAWRTENFTFHREDGSPHVPNEEGLGLSGAKHPSNDFAWINHYFLKSAEEFLWKWSRNRGDHGRVAGVSNKVLEPWAVRDFIANYDPGDRPRITLDQCAPTFDAERARLKSLPGVERALSAVQEIYGERIKAIIPMFVDAPAILETGEEGQTLLSILGLAPAKNA